jgi:hypothetical protein
MYTEKQIATAFGRLTLALGEHGPLPCENGSTRVVQADEFMLMGSADDGTLFFKHGFTRNYVTVSSRDTLKVSNDGTPFNRGTFDGYPEEK